jgi:ubiquinone/menaquinone biosynthesis C-methylase UbiE
MKLHLCCGDIYLLGYINCDIVGEKIENFYLVDEIIQNPNATTLDNYFKDPFEKDVTKRKRKQFIIDVQMNILEKWPFEDNSVDEIVMISGFEHFEHLTELPHIISEAYRVLRKGGIWKFDFPDIYNQVKKYHGIDAENDEFMIELIYCNHKNKYSVHQWGYTEKTLPKYLKPNNWQLEFKQVVKHDYPMIGVFATKI